MLQLDEVREVLERTERLAVRSAFALCLAFEMMQRSAAKPAQVAPDLDSLRSEIDRVSAALGEILSGSEGVSRRGASGVGEHDVRRIH